jgi:hypothetical protein
MRGWAKTTGAGAIGAVLGAFVMYVARPSFPEASAIFSAWLASPSAWLAFAGVCLGPYAIQRTLWRLDDRVAPMRNGWWTLSLAITGLAMTGASAYTIISIAATAGS